MAFEHGKSSVLEEYREAVGEIIDEGRMLDLQGSAGIS